MEKNALVDQNSSFWTSVKWVSTIYTNTAEFTNVAGKIASSISM